MHALRYHFIRHWRFYLAAALGIGGWFATGALAPLLRYAAAGDVFFVTYLVLMTVLAFRTKPADLESSARVEDEGITLIIVVTFAVLIFVLASVFSLLNERGKPDALHLALTVASAPLGWFMLHTVAAFHYAHRYYAAGKAGLQFDDTDDPGIWDFLYHSFVIGMTAQVSDVQVVSTPMRQLVLGHGIASFFYNTVLLALAVNIVVILATT